MRPVLIALFLLVALDLAPAPETTTTIFVVRHAEKGGEPGERDPELTAAGQARAAALARALRSAGVEAAYASQFRRTRATLEPLAKARGLEVQVLPAGQEEELAKKIVTDRLGKTVVVAGHSNTVPKLLAALGAETPPDLGESDYDDLFMVQVTPKGRAILTRLHYGAPNP